MSNINDIVSIIATPKDGKAKMVAIMADGSEVIVRKTSAMKAWANVYAEGVNGNASGLASHITINAKPFVVTYGHRPVKSIEITYV
jgi:hypothetical protein